MAKKETAKKGIVRNLQRKRKIKECPCKKDANGLPKSKEFTAEPFVGNCCEECLEVIDYVKSESTKSN